MKAFGYVRVSGEGQISGDGFDRQEEAILNYAAKHDMEIVKIYREEGVSGTKEQRPALADMMVAMEANGLDVHTVIIEKADRLARDLMVQEAIIADFVKHNWRLVSSHEGDLIAEHGILAEDPTRKLIRQVFGAFASYEKDMIVLKLRAARDRMRIREGRCEGRKFLEESTEGQEVMKELKRLHRKPKGGKRLSLKEIASNLNAKGFRTSTGKEFDTQRVANLLRGNRKTPGDRKP